MGRTGNDNGKGEMRGFFAALRMTKGMREIMLEGEPRPKRGPPP
jgi:hypothetical protein